MHSFSPPSGPARSPLLAQSRDYTRVAAALRRLAEGESADLCAAARDACLSPHHFQRMFRRWAGVSPHKFAAQLTLAELKRRMARGESVLAASAAAGLSGAARAHDVFVSHDAMTPGVFRRRGESAVIRFGEAQTPYGPAALAFSDFGVCALRFLPDDSSAQKEIARILMRDYPKAKTVRDDGEARKIALDILKTAGGARRFSRAGLISKSMCGGRFWRFRRGGLRVTAGWRGRLAVPARRGLWGAPPGRIRLHF